MHFSLNNETRIVYSCIPKIKTTIGFNVKQKNLWESDMSPNVPRYFKFDTMNRM